MNRHIVWLLLDGLRKDKAEHYLSDHAPFKQGKSGLKQLLQLGASCHATNCSTVFPSITLAAHASMVTGKYPAHTGIAGNNYFHNNEVVNWESAELAPTLFGFYDEFGGPFGPENWAAVLNQPQQKMAGCGGLDKELASHGVATVYDILRSHGCASHVVYGFYSHGAGDPDFPSGHEDVSYLGDGWDPPDRESVFFGNIFGNNDEESFFNHFDLKSSETACSFIRRLYDNRLKLPELLMVYFPSIDHATHLLGLLKDGRDIQLEFLGKVDELLDDILNTLKQCFPQEYENAVFILSSDHGHQQVDPDKVILPSDITAAIYSGPYANFLTQPISGGYTLDPGYLRIALNGTMAQLRYLSPDLLSIPEEQWAAVIGNLNEKLLRPRKLKSVIARAGQLTTAPSTDYCFVTVYGDRPGHLWTEPWPISAAGDSAIQQIEAMLNDTRWSGDILLLANEADGWQFAGSRTHAKELVISVPFIVDFHMRIPFSECYANSSTHGSVGTMDVPLVFFGKPLATHTSLQRKSNVVDIVPTILSILGLPWASYGFDGRPLLDSALGTTPEIPTDMRKMIEQSVEHVRTAITRYLEFLQRAVSGDVMGASELSNKVFNYADRNLASAFEFAGRLAQVRDFRALTSLQVEFIQAQMQAMAEQAKDLSEAMTKAMMDGLKAPTKGGLSS